MKRLYLICCLMIFCLPAFSQEYSYRHFTILDGLVQNQVTKLYQDQRGFIWVGTKGGASRFDGVHFRNFTLSDGLPGGLVQGFLELNNELYVYTTYGISVLRDGEFQLLHTFLHPQLNNIRLAPDSSNAFILYQNQIYVADHLGCRLLFSHNRGKWIADVATEQGSGKLLFSADDGLFRLDGPQQLTQIQRPYATSLMPGKQNVYFVTPYNGLNSIGYEGIYKLEHDLPVMIFKGNGFSMTSTLGRNREGNLIFFPKTSCWMEIDTTGRILDQDSLGNVMFTSFFCDREGNYWIGSETGLYFLQSVAFRNYGEKSGVPPYVWSIFETADSAIAFAGYDGALCLMKDKKITPVPSAKYRVRTGEKFYMNGFCNSLGEWVIPMDGGDVLIHNKYGFDRLHFMVNGDLPATFCAYEDTTEQRIYFGTTSGLIVYDLKMRTWKCYPTDKHNVLFVEEDLKHRKWICTNAGLLLFEKDSLKKMALPGMLAQTGAVSCKRDPWGNMWLACKDGIYLYTRGQCRKIVNGRYFFLSLYNGHYLIAGTITGFMFLDLDAFYRFKPECIRFFDRYNGFSGIECGQNGTCTDREGNVWIPASDKVVKFMPDNIKPNLRAPATFIASFDIASSDLDWTPCRDEYSLNDSIIELQSDYRNVRFHFCGISLSCPEKVLYRTRLSGFDETWSLPNKSTEVVYTNLDPGTYRFELLARNSDGVWTTRPFVMTFKVLPEFWETWWFLTLCVVGIVLLLAVFVFHILQLRRKRELHRQQVEKELVSLQLNTINAQLDPHFIFNTLTAIGADIQENRSDLAYAYFVKVSDFLRNSMSGNTGITRTLKEELDFVENYLVLQKYRFGERLHYDIDIHESVNTGMIVPRMCIQIFVENAVKHGLEHKRENGKIAIRLQSSGNMLTVEIADDGIGRAASEKLNTRSNGKGLLVFEQFFILLNRFNEHSAGFKIHDLFDQNQQPAGTLVILSIPEGFRFHL